MQKTAAQPPHTQAGAHHRRPGRQRTHPASSPGGGIAVPPHDDGYKLTYFFNADPLQQQTTTNKYTRTGVPKDGYDSIVTFTYSATLV
jgi:hypothetical protein